MPRPLLPLAVLALAACAGTAPREVTAAMAPDDDTPAHQRCARVQPGMSVAQVAAVMGRDPDSSLSGHIDAGPGGDPPAGTYTIDSWYSLDAEGRHLASSVHYHGATVEAVECARPVQADAAPAPATPPTSPAPSGT